MEGKEEEEMLCGGEMSHFQQHHPASVLSTETIRTGKARKETWQL